MEQQLLNGIFLPYEVMTRIISYLGVADIRSCRLVCRRWRTCCEDKIFTRAEKFVFHSAAHLTSEINEFLMNLERERINLQLNKIELRELKFNAFGDKIEELELINCLVDEETLKNFFYLTPNMTRLQVRLIDHRFFPYKTVNADLDPWKAVMNLLYEQKFQHHNLKDFDSNLYWIDTLQICLVEMVYGRAPECNLGDTFLSHIFFVFPCLQNIHFGESRWSCSKLTMQNLLPQTNLTNFGGIFKMNFDREDQLETFASLFPRLKSLQLAVNISDWKCSSLSLCEKFFSLLTELESLNLEYAVTGRMQTYHWKVIKVSLFQILKSCSKLRELRLTWPRQIKTEICLNRDEVQEFSSLIKKIKSLWIPKIFVEFESGETMVALPKTHGDLKELRFEEEFTQSSDLRCLIMKTHQLTTLCVSIRGDSLSENFGTILQSQHCLRTLKIVTSMNISDMPIFQIKSNEGIQSKHERLSHLEYIFIPTQEDYPIDYFLERLCLWEFPNLLHLYVSSGGDINCITVRWLQTTTPKLENTFKDWIGSMTTLTHVNVHVGAGLLNFQEFAHVCKKLPRLQSIIWSGREHGTLQITEVKNVFNNLPNLRSMSYPKRDEVYKYNRYKELLSVEKGL